MKKVKIEGKLSLDKMTIARLNEHEINAIVGGINLSRLLRCGTYNIQCESQPPKCVPF